jgi:general secretion pathway protein D
VIRDTPDRILLAGKIIDDIDKAKPEVVIQVAVMEARRDRMRNVGITPPTSVSASFANPGTSSSSSGSSTSSSAAATISQLVHNPDIFSAGYSITMPEASRPESASERRVPVPESSIRWSTRSFSTLMSA